MTSNLTPMMRQYLALKREHPDAILLFHLGDFYEMFYEDAEIASRILGIALTTRDRNKADAVPLCGIPCHAADNYINRLLEEGHKVAICDQVEAASASRGLVKREVTRIITPGTILDERLLDSKSNNFLIALNREKALYGLSAADLSTGEFAVLEVKAEKLQELEDHLAHFDPSEILLPEDADTGLLALVSQAAPRVSSPTLCGAERFDSRLARDLLLHHFGLTTLDAFGCQDFTAGITAAGALLAYIQDTQRRPLSNIAKLTPMRAGSVMHIDATSQRNLEIVSSLESGRRQGSLLAVIDRSVSPMGGRRLRSWLLSPLLEPAAIEARLETVGEISGRTAARASLRSLIGNIYDLERLAGRISLNTCSPQDVAALRDSLRVLPALKDALSAFASPLLRELRGFDDMADVLTRIEETLAESPPPNLKSGGIIREGYSTELDSLRARASDASQWLSRFEREERERSGISSLKVGFNKIYGYYVEITKSNLGQVPADYSRTQTLVNAERFQTPRLREFQERILGSEEKSAQLELSLFDELRRSLASESARLQVCSAAISNLDVLQSFAQIAVEKNYCRPVIEERSTTRIVAGRHPVIEDLGDESFVPNDCHLDSEGCQIMIITGPNMAGKSTYLRQVALITLMAHAGSFVPAKEALIGLTDRIFTRIGASDKLARGQSTFMVEMIETAAILHGSTPRSLVILDEVGRGTSTFDGLSIAWAVAESLHGSGSTGPRTIFATHYHHLTELPSTLPRARNFNVAVKEWEREVLFLRKIVEGGTDKSYGIHVAELAGLPQETVQRAREILENMERNEFNLDGLPRISQTKPGPAPALPSQLAIFPTHGEEIIRKIAAIDLTSTTPLEALVLLSGLKEDIDKNKE